MIFYASSLEGAAKAATGSRADRTLKTIQKRETRKKKGHDPEAGRKGRGRVMEDSEDSEEFRC